HVRSRPSCRSRNGPQLSRRCRYRLLRALWRLGIHVDGRKFQKRGASRGNGSIQYLRPPRKVSCYMTRHVMVQKPKRIGLLDHFGTGNLGDDATIQATLQHITSRWPHALIVGLSLYPVDSQTRHGIPAYAIRQEGFSPFAFIKDKDKLKDVLRKYPLLFSVLRTVTNVAIKKPMSFFRETLFLAKSFRVAKSLDLLIISGGGQLLDAWGGPWAFPYTLFKWVLLAKLSHTKCYFVNVGAGPLDYPLSKWFIKIPLLLADYVSFRDGKSKMLIREIGFRNRTQVVADSVYGLNIPEVNITRSHVGGG